MVVANWVFTIINTVVAFLGVYFTWKSYRKTKTIKETLEIELKREQFLSRSSELREILDKNMSTVLSDPSRKLSDNTKFVSSLNYVILCLESFFSENPQTLAKITALSNTFRSLPKIGPENQTSQYGLLISGLQAIIDTGRI